MSKMDAVRAMREARYAEAQARAAGPTKKTAARKAAPAPSAPARATPAAAASPAVDATAGATETDGRCGHRNMSGRTCTREQGHPQKSHRYS